MASVFLFTRCFRAQVLPDPRGDAYAGSETCIRCHASISKSYAHTAHFFSTRIADSVGIAGNFSPGFNTFRINQTTEIRMEKRDSGYYQVLYEGNQETEAHRFDLVMGAVKGQTYLYWKGNQFFQLPVSYLAPLHQWTASPGYSISGLNFSRPVLKECFGCHSSFASGDPHGWSGDGIQKNSWVFNIDCERCHGPSEAHVRFHEEHPEEKKAKFITSFQSLGQQQKIDLCAVCHSGTKHILLKSTFAFQVGDSLSSFMIPLQTGDQLDVHGNQTQLLAQSKCFRMSSIDCTTCHNAHEDQRGMIKTFNERCQGCHPTVRHETKMISVANRNFLQDNCTTCHMPAQASRTIELITEKNTTAIPAMVINHRIAIYPEESAKTMGAGK